MKLKLFFLPISIVLTLVAIIWFIKPGWEENRELKKELSKEKEILQGLVEKGDALNKALSYYQALAQRKNLINTAIPTSAENDKLVAEINDQASIAGLFLNKIDIKEMKVKASEMPTQIKAINAKDELENSETSKSSDKPDETLLVKATVGLDVVGDYVNIKNFIKALGQTNRFIKIVSVNVDRSSEQEDSIPGMVSGKLVCEAFYEPRDEKIIISEAVFSGEDRATKVLLTGKISEEVINNFESQRTPTVYEIILGEKQAGKENIFIGNTSN